MVRTCASPSRREGEQLVARSPAGGCTGRRDRVPRVVVGRSWTTVKEQMGACTPGPGQLGYLALACRLHRARRSPPPPRTAELGRPQGRDMSTRRHLAGSPLADPESIGLLGVCAGGGSAVAPPTRPGALTRPRRALAARRLAGPPGLRRPDAVRQKLDERSLGPRGVPAHRNRPLGAAVEETAPRPRCTALRHYLSPARAECPSGPTAFGRDGRVDLAHLQPDPLGDPDKRPDIVVHSEQAGFPDERYGASRHWLPTGPPRVLGWRHAVRLLRPGPPGGLRRSRPSTQHFANASTGLRPRRGLTWRQPRRTAHRAKASRASTSTTCASLRRSTRSPTPSRDDGLLVRMVNACRVPPFGGVGGTGSGEPHGSARREEPAAAFAITLMTS